jgi:hypothetical protein
MVAVRPHEQFQSADPHFLAQRDVVLHHRRLLEPELVSGPDHTDDARTRRGVAVDHEALVERVPPRPQPPRHRLVHDGHSLAPRPVGVLNSGVMGLVYALYYVLRGRIALPIVAHALFGAWSIALAVVMVSRTVR